MIGAAVMVARIATGEVEDTKGKAPNVPGPGPFDGTQSADPNTHP